VMAKTARELAIVQFGELRGERVRSVAILFHVLGLQLGLRRDFRGIVA
jgi:hypothetical protein